MVRTSVIRTIFGFGDHVALVSKFVLKGCQRIRQIRNSALGEFGIGSVITIVIMKALYTYCRSKLKNESFAELWFTALKEIGTYHLSCMY